MTGSRSLPLPQTVVEHFNDIKAGPGNIRTRYQRMAGYRDACKEAGYPVVSIAKALGLSRQAVDQWGSGRTDTADLPPVPMPPPPDPLPETPDRGPKDVPDDVAETMQRLVRLAEQVNGRTPAGSPLKAAGKELAEVMAGQVRDGVSINRVAKAAGQTRNAVAFRLARYGYTDLVADWTIRYVERNGG